KIIALPDCADRGILPIVPGYSGLERAHNRWYRSKCRRRKSFPMWGVFQRIHFLDVQNCVQMIGHDYIGVRVDGRKVVGNLDPAGTDDLPETGFVNLTVLDTAEDTFSVDRTDGEEVRA
ncbi:MAG: hypothetical protein WBL50_26085, partial [Candidatus Acidiferrum sp.]